MATEIATAHLKADIANTMLEAFEVLSEPNEVVRRRPNFTVLDGLWNLEEIAAALLEKYNITLKDYEGK